MQSPLVEPASQSSPSASAPENQTLASATSHAYWSSTPTTIYTDPSSTPAKDHCPSDITNTDSPTPWTLSVDDIKKRLTVASEIQVQAAVQEKTKEQNSSHD